MKPKLDLNKTYAVALEGGGAKGAYEIGVWKALEEMGIRYNAVSGTSVGALNGALMAMRDLPRAIAAWSDIRLDKVINYEADEEENLRKIVSGEIDLGSIQDVIRQAFDVIHDRGLDVAPLRAWVHEVVDSKKIKTSDVALFIATVSLTDRKGLELRLNDLEEEEIYDMLLASAYHPSFRLEKLGGKLYADGGFIDNLPLHVLVENGYKDIIAVRLPGGMGRERRFKIPEDVEIHYIDTDADLGGVLNFDAEQARRDMKIGYFDAWHDLCGLWGKHYYIERGMSEREAFEQIVARYQRRTPGVSLRELCEEELLRIGKALGVGGDYYDFFIALLEIAAAECALDPFRFYGDRELLSAVRDALNARKEEAAATAEEESAGAERGEELCTLGE
ncbi:MAG: patatin-like phospholipase family protein [Oscillospiraceae bacterium]|nr:patatin-like phospholipase family protein [Oscillospiraceae bacterium]